MEKKEYEELLSKYTQKIEQEFNEQSDVASRPITSQSYHQFKKELYPTHLTFYEKACNSAEKLLRASPDGKQKEQLEKDIATCHLNVTPTGVVSLSFLAPLLYIMVGALISFAVFQMLFFVIFFFVTGIMLILVLQKMPSFMANSWRMRASAQMVQSIFYMVTYMRHTSNIERAIEFASNHLEAPLSLEFRKILWDVENQEFPTIKEAAADFLDRWKEWDKEFVESFHLIESSLYESQDARRVTLLDKALDVILNGTYENMLHYAHSLKSPMTMLHMLGIILPILGLVILPLVVSFMGSGSSPFTSLLYISIIYNVSLPIAVYYLGRTILAKRPAGYGASDTSHKHKKLQNVNLSLSKQVKLSVNPLYFAIMIGVVGAIIGFSPIILHTIDSSFEIQNAQGTIKLMDYVCPPERPNCSDTERVGPYGLGASLLSLFVTGALGVAIGLYYYLRSKNVLKIREQTRKLEDEFSSALFQLGNRLGDGLPAEIAFGKVAQTMQGTTSGDFFARTQQNMMRLGMGIEQALFDKKAGSLLAYKSAVIESSMKVLIESAKKGPRIAAESLLSMARYIKQIHRVEERLKDLMGDVISSMKAQVSFLTPAISGIVIGITSMIATILTRLAGQLSAYANNGQQVGAWADMLTIFGIGIPTFHFQIVVGIYIVQIAFILTILSNGIENGSDKLGERFVLGRNLTMSTLLYCFIAGLVMLAFNLFANQIMKTTLLG